MGVRYAAHMYQPPEIILDLFAAYRHAAGLPELSRLERLRLLTGDHAPEPRGGTPATLIPFPGERRPRGRAPRR